MRTYWELIVAICSLICMCQGQEYFFEELGSNCSDAQGFFAQRTGYCDVYTDPNGSTSYQVTCNNNTVELEYCVGSTCPGTNCSLEQSPIGCIAENGSQIAAYVSITCGPLPPLVGTAFYSYWAGTGCVGHADQIVGYPTEVCLEGTVYRCNGTTVVATF
jgi:hypothetical protein